MDATLCPLPRTSNPVMDQWLCPSKHHTDVQTGPYMHITIKARWGFWLKTSIYPTIVYDLSLKLAAIDNSKQMGVAVF